MNILKDIKTFINTEYNIIKNEIVQNTEKLKKSDVTNYKHTNGHIEKPNQTEVVETKVVDSSDKSNTCPLKDNNESNINNGKQIKSKKTIELKFLLDDSRFFDRLHQKSNIKINCTEKRCMGSALHSAKLQPLKKSKEEIIDQATDFINQFYASVKR